MYYPYLRGRQFELIALREYALQYGGNNNITPIIELVKKTFNNIRLAIPKLIQGNVKFALILNPQDGELDSSVNILDELENELSDISKWIPAYIVTNNYNEIISRIETGNLQEVMLICSDMVDTSNPDFENLLFSNEVKYVVSRENRTLKRKLEGKGKEKIRLDDNFKPEKRNSDYLELGEEKFSEEHMFFQGEGYQGFSDYTALRSDFVNGGGAAYAVSIHLTYEKDNKEIWVRHFTSETNDSIANVQGKFSEASIKAVNFLNEHNIHNHATDELRRYVNEQKYPGLGMVKKISIKNHLELVNSILNSN